MRCSRQQKDADAVSTWTVARSDLLTRWNDQPAANAENREGARRDSAPDPKRLSGGVENKCRRRGECSGQPPLPMFRSHRAYLPRCCDYLSKETNTKVAEFLIELIRLASVVVLIMD